MATTGDANAGKVYIIQIKFSVEDSDSHVYTLMHEHLHRVYRYDLTPCYSHSTLNATFLSSFFFLQPKDVATCYNLACCSALSGNVGACRHALEHAVGVVISGKAHGGSSGGRGGGGVGGQPKWADTAPTIERGDLSSDDDLGSVRGEDWFAALVASLPE